MVTVAPSATVTLPFVKNAPLLLAVAIVKVSSAAKSLPLTVKVSIPSVITVVSRVVLKDLTAVPSKTPLRVEITPSVVSLKV